MVEYKLIRSRRKTIGLEVNFEGVLVRAPFYASQNDIDRFVAQHKYWIEKHLAMVEEQRQQTDRQDVLSKEEIEALAGKAMQVIPERVRFYAPKTKMSR